MAYSPVDVRHVHLERGVLGYRRAAVDRVLAEVADSFEEVWRQRVGLAERVEQLEAEVNRHRELEALLRTTLMSAERAGEELKEQARREGELILREAQAEARAITRGARAQHDRLSGESRRLRALLRSALAAVEEGDADEHGDRAQPEAVDGRDAKADADAVEAEAA